MLAALLTDFKDALLSGLAGTSRPSQLQAGGMWIDTTLQSPPTYQWIYKFWTGTIDVEVFRINVSSNYGGSLTSEATFEILQISADTVGALQELVKNRIDNNGQVLSGDVVGEIQFVGRTNTSGNPTSAYLKWTATDNQTASISGGTFSFYATPDASSTIIEHLRFIDGQAETLAPLLANAIQPVSQNIATASTIVQLNADKSVIEFTGATPTDIQGINSGGSAREISLHNRSSASVVLKHENGSATAADRMDLPGSLDYTIEPDNTITLFYSTAAARWKLKSSGRIGATHTQEVIYQINLTSWVAPTDVTKIDVSVMRRLPRLGSLGFLDGYGNLYSTGGSNGAQGELGIGVGGFPAGMRSSPVAVLGGLQFTKQIRRPIGFSGQAFYGITSGGTMYAWGSNDHGQLGVGDITSRSTPVAISGGLTLRNMAAGQMSTYAWTGDGVLYAWGNNTKGQLGTGDVTPRSTPTAVVGGFRFKDVHANGVNNGGTVLALSQDGFVYAWGGNEGGEAGQGAADITARSSPVAVTVINALKVKKIFKGGRADTPRDTEFALTEDGDLYIWGTNANGQIGDSSRTNRGTPTLVDVGGVKWKDFWAEYGGTSVIAQTVNGTYYGWGQNGHVFGIGDSTAHRSSPVVATALAGFEFEEIAPGNGCFFGLQNGVWYAWGNNLNGSLGTGSGSLASSPTAVAGGLKFAELYHAANSGWRTWGITQNGQVYAWGHNFFGGVGDGTTTDRSSPTLVAGNMGSNPTYESESYTLDVIPGNTYVVKTGIGLGFFGNQPIGANVERVMIDYNKRGNT